MTENVSIPVRANVASAKNQERQLAREARGVARRTAERAGSRLRGMVSGGIVGGVAGASIRSVVSAGAVDPFGIMGDQLKAEASLRMGTHRHVGAARATREVTERMGRFVGLGGNMAAVKSKMPFETEMAQTIERGRAILRTTEGFGVGDPGTLMAKVLQGYIELLDRSKGYIASRF